MDSEVAKARDLKNGRIGRLASSQVAREVLQEYQQKYNINFPPYDPELAANIYGISVETTNYLSTSSGRLITTQEKIQILLNKMETKNRRRFSCAHELAHAILRGYIKRDMNETVVQQGPRVEEEYRANIFAESFLMPEKDVVDVFSSFSNALEAEIVMIKLSSVFEVHEYAMIYRLAKLELPVKPWFFLIMKYMAPTSKKVSETKTSKLRVLRSATSEMIYIPQNLGADSIGLSVSSLTLEQINNFHSLKSIERLSVKTLNTGEGAIWKDVEIYCQATYRSSSSPATGPVILGFFTIKETRVLS